MPDNSAKIKLAQQTLASHKSKLASTANKDQVKRSIKATQEKIAELKKTHSK